MGVKGINGDKNYDGRDVNLMFIIGNSKDEQVVFIRFISSSLITIFTEGRTGFNVYHPTNSETIDKLVEYIQTHGTKQ